MKPSWLMSSVVMSLLQWTLPHMGAAQSADEAAIRQVEAQQAEAWNQHDAHAYASLFTEDGDMVNVVGWWWKGRSEIERQLTEAHDLRANELQRISAGSGIVHSEYNASPSEPVHFLQIWIEPAKEGIEPGYEQKTFADADKPSEAILYFPILVSRVLRKD